MAQSVRSQAGGDDGGFGRGSGLSGMMTLEIDVFKYQIGHVVTIPDGEICAAIFREDLGEIGEIDSRDGSAGRRDLGFIIKVNNMLSVAKFEKMFFQNLGAIKMGINLLQIIKP